MTKTEFPKSRFARISLRSIKTGLFENVERTMQIDETRKGELPWAYAKRDGFKGDAPGLYFHYFRNADDAHKSRRAAIRQKKYAGPVVLRPNEAWSLGEIRF